MAAKKGRSFSLLFFTLWRSALAAAISQRAVSHWLLVLASCWPKITLLAAVASAGAERGTCNGTTRRFSDSKDIDIVKETSVVLRYDRGASVCNNPIALMATTRAEGSATVKDTCVPTERTTAEAMTGCASDRFWNWEAGSDDGVAIDRPRKHGRSDKFGKGPQMARLLQCLYRHLVHLQTIRRPKRPRVVVSKLKSC